jgi:hypothetical protein
MDAAEEVSFLDYQITEIIKIGRAVLLEKGAAFLFLGLRFRELNL